MSDFAATLTAEGLTTDSINANAGLQKLSGDAKSLAKGQFVLEDQKLASDKGFRNVSHIWYDKTMSYEQGLQKLEEDRAKTIDITATVLEMVPTVNDNGQFAFLHRPTEQYYTPTEHAMGQIGNWAGTGTWTPINLMKNPKDLKGNDEFARDKGDAEALAHLLRNGLRRLDPKKNFFWRCRVDGTMRAMLTERFAKVDNRWFIELLAKFIPGGRMSHWRGDSDTLYGNILIPDTIREETDSPYGGMLSIGNSEIGERRVSSLPSIFRAICMNGCIWGQTKGKGIKQVHRGKINLDHLALEIKENLNLQIPLLPVGIDRFLGTRTYAWDGCEIKPIFAQVAKQYKLSKAQASALLTGYNTERQLTPDLDHTLFTVINAVTRTGQERSNDEWLNFDEVGGYLSEYSKDDFDTMVKRAKSLKTEEVDEAFVKMKV